MKAKEVAQLKKALIRIEPELKNRRIPDEMWSAVTMLLKNMLPSSRRHAIILIKSLRDLNEQFVRSQAALKALDKSINLDVARQQAIDQEEAERAEKENKEKNEVQSYRKSR